MLIWNLRSIPFVPFFQPVFICLILLSSKWYIATLIFCSSFFFFLENLGYTTIGTPTSTRTLYFLSNSLELTFLLWSDLFSIRFILTSFLEEKWSQLKNPTREPHVLSNDKDCLLHFRKQLDLNFVHFSFKHFSSCPIVQLFSSLWS